MQMYQVRNTAVVCRRLEAAATKQSFGEKTAAKQCYTFCCIQSQHIGSICFNTQPSNYKQYVSIVACVPAYQWAYGHDYIIYLFA